MPCFLLTFGDASRPPVGTVIIQAPSMFQARMTAVVRRLAPGVPFGEGLKLTAKLAVDNFTRASLFLRAKKLSQETNKLAGPQTAGRSPIVRRQATYRAVREWIKVKNRGHPAFERAMLIALSKRTGSRSR
jgi:hypothetical protein